MVRVKEVVEVMEKKTTRKWTVEETNLFCSLLSEPVTKFMLTLEQKTMEEPFKTSNEKWLKGKESLNLDIKNLDRRSNTIKKLWRKLRDKKNNDSGLTGA